MKLSCAQTVQEDLLAGPICTLAQAVLQQHLAADWFFIRYTDPEPHIRLRSRGDPLQLLCHLLSELCRWGEHLMSEGPCQKFTFDVYEREIERYGGPVGIGVAEQFFCADSTAIVEMLALLHAGRKGRAVRESASDLGDPQILAALSADDMLAGLGLSPQQRLQRYRAVLPTRKASGALYRQKGAHLRALPGDPLKLADLAGGETVLDFFATRRAQLAALARQLEQAVAQGALTRPTSLIYQSLYSYALQPFLGC